MTSISTHKNILSIIKSTKEVLMENRSSSGPVIIRFANTQDVIDYTYRLELKCFLARLLYRIRSEKE